MSRVRVCFVCLGNICRSPLAEAVLRQKVLERGLADRVEVASRGTGDWHLGEPPDARMNATAERHGVPMGGVAEKFDFEDFLDCHLILPMDGARFADLTDEAPPAALPRIVPFRAFDPEGTARDDVPDPYYGGPDGFERVYEIVARTCEALLDRLEDGSWRSVPGGRKAMG